MWYVIESQLFGGATTASSPRSAVTLTIDRTSNRVCVESDHLPRATPEDSDDGGSKGPCTSTECSSTACKPRSISPRPPKRAHAARASAKMAHVARRGLWPTARARLSNSVIATTADPHSTQASITEARVSSVCSLTRRTARRRSTNISRKQVRGRTAAAFDIGIAGSVYVWAAARPPRAREWAVPPRPVRPRKVRRHRRKTPDPRDRSAARSKG